jgi:hypothetical protein
VIEPSPLVLAIEDGVKLPDATVAVVFVGDQLTV